MKEKIVKLTAQQRKQLALAFDSGIAQIVKFGDNEFVGINLRCFRNLEVLETIKSWTYGLVKGD